MRIYIINKMIANNYMILKVNTEKDLQSVKKESIDKAILVLIWAEWDQ